MTNTKGNDSIKKVRELRRVLTEDAKQNYVNQGMTEEEIILISIDVTLVTVPLM